METMAESGNPWAASVRHPLDVETRGVQPCSNSWRRRDMTGWATGPLVAFDTETTGLDMDADRIVTAYVGDGSTRGLSWLVDPGVAIPAKATAIQGITTDEARAHGRPAAGAIGEIVDALARALRMGSLS